MAAVRGLRVDSENSTIDFLLSSYQDRLAAKHFLQPVLWHVGLHRPRIVNVNDHASQWFRSKKGTLHTIQSYESMHIRLSDRFAGLNEDHSAYPRDDHPLAFTRAFSRVFATLQLERPILFTAHSSYVHPPTLIHNAIG
jgi:hypothetical protein